jgi:hypothetical protein
VLAAAAAAAALASLLLVWAGGRERRLQSVADAVGESAESPVRA